MGIGDLAQTEDLEIGIVVSSLLYAPIWLAERRGFLAEEGLRVKLRSFGTTDRVTAALHDGVVPVTVGSPEGSILDAMKGGELRTLRRLRQQATALDDRAAALSLPC